MDDSKKSPTGGKAGESITQALKTKILTGAVRDRQNIIVPSCANAAFVEFASAQYRHLNPEWSFFAAVNRFLDQLPDDQWDLVFFDCPPAALRQCARPRRSPSR